MLLHIDEWFKNEYTLLLIENEIYHAKMDIVFVYK